MFNPLCCSTAGSGKNTVHLCQDPQGDQLRSSEWQTLFVLWSRITGADVYTTGNEWSAGTHILCLCPASWSTVERCVVLDPFPGSCVSTSCMRAWEWGCMALYVLLDWDSQLWFTNNNNALWLLFVCMLSMSDGWLLGEQSQMQHQWLW